MHLWVAGGISHGIEVRAGRHVSNVQILLQKSKIEQPKKSRESRSQGFSTAASLVSDTAETRGRFWMKRYGPSRRRTSGASAALRIFVRHPKKTFATISATTGLGED
jgi:hypothetical protein